MLTVYALVMLACTGDHIYDHTKPLPQDIGACPMLVQAINLPLDTCMKQMQAEIAAPEPRGVFFCQKLSPSHEAEKRLKLQSK